MPPLTITIIARNAEATIVAAIRSIKRDNAYPILLVDDFSSDNTADAARDIAGNQITVVRPPRHVGTGLARQTALDHVGTPYGLWLDADDEMLPGRAEAHVQALSAGADLVYESCYLVSEDGGRTRLDNPEFLMQPGGMLRCFERNWVHGLWGGYRAEFARSVGYDPSFKAAEDYDFLLRALLKRPQIAFIPDPMVLHYDRPGTVSRQVDVTTTFSQAAKRKHDRVAVNKALKDFDLGWLVRAQMDMADGRFADAAKLLRRQSVSQAALIPPYGKSERWVALYLSAICHIKIGEYAAAEAVLAEAQALGHTPEGFNALGVLARMRGDETAARACFRSALDLYSDYFDARENLAHKEATRITPSPLRGQHGRNIY